jgi:omega-6 fatty acid desaturase (delta-12 desaturase)
MRKLRRGDEMREGKELIDASRPFAEESRARSWLELASTLAAIAVATAVAAAAPWWPVRLAAAIVSGLVIVRGFILYHDYMHGALLRKSSAARAIMFAYGTLVLTPPRVWRETHNYHHAHNAKIVGSHVGSYPVVTVEMWKKLRPIERAMYRIARHPLTVLLGYGAIFLYGMCASSFLRRPTKNWDSALALVVHFAIAVAIGWTFGVATLMFTFILPLMVACAMGAYLFYAQHNFEGVHLQGRHEWSYTRAAIESSSYMKMGPVMEWFTGNIGYHQVHHLNPTIPFYRLPEAMAEIPELQAAKVTSLHPRDVLACFRLKLWDPAQGRMVGYSAVREV